MAGPAGASDWSDLDLLTVSEATARLDEELSAVRRELDRLAAEDDERGLTEARRRLELLLKARQLATRPTAVIDPGPVRSLAEVARTPGPPDQA